MSIDAKSGSFCLASAIFAPKPPNPPALGLAAAAAAGAAASFFAPSLPGSRSAGIRSGTTVSGGSAAGREATASPLAEAIALRVASVWAARGVRLR